MQQVDGRKRWYEEQEAELKQQVEDKLALIRKFQIMLDTCTDERFFQELEKRVNQATAGIEENKTALYKVSLLNLSLNLERGCQASICPAWCLLPSSLDVAPPDT